MLVAHTEPCPKAKPEGGSTGILSTTRFVCGSTLNTTSPGYLILGAGPIPEYPEETHTEPAPNATWLKLGIRPLSGIVATTAPVCGSILRRTALGMGPPSEVANSSSVCGSSPTKSVLGGPPGPPAAPSAPGGEALAEALAEGGVALMDPIAHKEPSPKPSGRLPWSRGDTTFASKPTGFCAVWAFDRPPSGNVVSSLEQAA